MSKEPVTKKKQSPTNVRSDKVLAIPHTRVLEIFQYAPDRGRLLWKTKIARKIVPGTVAGQQAKDGYWYVGFDGQRLPLHHVIWFYHYGSWPTEYLGFKNGNYDDTHVENLKLLTASDKQTVDALQHFMLNAEQRAIKYSPQRKHWLVRYKGVKLGKFLTHKAAKDVYDKAVKGELDLTKQQEVNTKLALLRLRTPWRMLLKSGVPHGWESFPHFVETLGDRPGKLTKLRAKDPEKLLGPNNFEWEVLTAEEAQARRVAEASPNSAGERSYWLLKKFGISEKWYISKLEEQGGVCAICEHPETAIRQGKLLPLAVDHDHINGKLRGLLCHSCNRAIGSLRDDPNTIRKAADYVEKWRNLHSEPLPDNVVSLRGKPA